jgi:hypothetical protein
MEVVILHHDKSSMKAPNEPTFCLLPLKARDGTIVAFTKLDADDYEDFSRWAWRLSTDGYAVRNRGTGKDKRTIRLHREVNRTPDGLVTDHINGDKLDNRKSNLRSATVEQNNANSADRPRKSEYRGVYWQKNAGKWISQISDQGKVKHLGIFEDEASAAEAYDKEAIALRGEFARLNLPRAA